RLQSWIARVGHRRLCNVLALDRHRPAPRPRVASGRCGGSAVRRRVRLHHRAFRLRWLGPALGRAQGLVRRMPIVPDQYLATKGFHVRKWHFCDITGRLVRRCLPRYPDWMFVGEDAAANLETLGNAVTHARKHSATYSAGWSGESKSITQTHSVE